MNTNPIKSKLIFVHDFGHDSSSWDSLIGAVEADNTLNDKFEVYRFSHLSPWSDDFESLESTAEEFATWLEENDLYHSKHPYKFSKPDYIHLIGHGQGGYVLFHALKHFMDRNGNGIHNHFLHRIRQLVLFSTHLDAASAIEAIEMKLPAQQATFHGQSRPNFLNDLEWSIDDAIRHFEFRIMKADDFIPNEQPEFLPDELPVATLLLQGDKGPNALKRPQWFPKEAVKKIPADKQSIIQVENQGAAFAKIKSYLLNPIGHPKVYEIEQLQMKLCVEPLPLGPVTIKYGSHYREIWSENKGSQTRTIRISDHNICHNPPFRLRYGTTAPDGGIEGEYAPVNAQRAPLERVNLYEKEGKEFTFDFDPVANEEYRLSVNVYKGYDGVENQSTHFHLGNAKYFYRTINIELDLSQFSDTFYNLRKKPTAYFLDEDNHVCSETPTYRIVECVVPPVSADEADKKWAWELTDLRSGVIDLVWELVQTEIVVPPKPPGVTRTVKIFLASSSELRTERMELQKLINTENVRIRLAKQNIWLELIVWERESDALSPTRLQDEYNKRIPDCDLFVGLFASKLGKYTREEYDLAQGQFKKTGKPRIYLYFKDAQVNMKDLLEADQALFDLNRELKEAGHFNTYFTNESDLQKKFCHQINLYIDAVTPDTISS